MNSYNENLHAAVINSLQSQELDLKQVKSDANAAMFSLYYAQDAIFSAFDKLEEAKTKQQNAEIRKQQAIENSNISTNLVKSAGQSNQYLQQSINNTAVAASNVQVAANSILKLASDVGSVYNIIQAADFDTDIAQLVDHANDYITKSAYAAELASQLAMEASILTSQVPGATLQSKAKSTDSSMSNLLKIISTDYDTKSQAVAAANATLASDSIKEKQAEGVYEDTSVVYKATDAAYDATNKELNLDLTAVPDEGHESTNFTVNFDWIRSPFPETDKSVLYPVQNYYLIVVKDKQKNTFLIHDAENIIQNQPNRFINLEGFLGTPATPISQASKKDFKHLKHPKQSPSFRRLKHTASFRHLQHQEPFRRLKHVPQPSKVKPVLAERVPAQSPDLKSIIPVRHHFNATFNYLQIPGSNNQPSYVLHDSDGDAITTGVKYTVFIMAVYAGDYKRKLNTFDDFLSAPSQSFMLTYYLAKADFGTSMIKELVKKEKSKEKNQDKDVDHESSTIFFVVEENPDYADSVEYRCILLPVLNAQQTTDPIVTDEVNYMVTTGSLKELDDEIAELQKIAMEIDPQITAFNADYLAKESQIEVLEQKYPFLEYVEQWIKHEEQWIFHNISKTQPERSKLEYFALQCIDRLKKSKSGLKQPTGFLKNLETFIKDVEQFVILLLDQLLDRWRIMDLTQQRLEIIDKITMSNDSKIGFLFNLTLAEQVSPANYIPAGVFQLYDAEKKPGTKAGKDKSTNDTSSSVNFPPVIWQVGFPAGTTDNFGNLLIAGQLYIAVILSVSNAPEENLSKFSNTWTGYDNPFYFIPTSN